MIVCAEHSSTPSDPSKLEDAKLLYTILDLTVIFEPLSFSLLPALKFNDCIQSESPESHASNKIFTNVASNLPLSQPQCKLLPRFLPYAVRLRMSRVFRNHALKPSGILTMPLCRFSSPRWRVPLKTFHNARTTFASLEPYKRILLCVPLNSGVCVEKSSVLRASPSCHRTPAKSPSSTENRSSSPWIISTKTVCVRTALGHKNITTERSSTCKSPGCGLFERKIPTSYGMPLMINMPCFD